VPTAPIVPVAYYSVVMDDPAVNNTSQAPNVAPSVAQSGLFSQPAQPNQQPQQSVPSIVLSSMR